MTSPSGEGSGSVLKELLFNQYQGIVLGGVAALSLITLSPLPLLLWLGGECVLLPALDSVPAIRRTVHRRRWAGRRKEEEARRSALVSSLNPVSAKRYDALEHLCTLIERNYQGLHGISQVYLAEQRQKLDLVRDGCLLRLVALQRYERLLAHRGPSQVENEIAGVARELQQPDVSARTKAALQKNLELKQRLLEQIGEARDTMKALALELDSMGSLLEVLHQKSVSMRDPQAFSEELDTIVRQSEASERAVREMEALLGSESAGWATDASTSQAGRAAQPGWWRRVRER